MRLFQIALLALRAAVRSIVSTMREYGVASPYAGLSIQGRILKKVIRQANVHGCPETLIIAKFDDGFYGIVAEKNGALRYFTSYPFNEQFAQLMACMEQEPVVSVEETEQPCTLGSIEVHVRVSPDYILTFDVNVGTSDRWSFRGVMLQSIKFVPNSASDHPLDGANLEKLSPMIFDQKAIGK
jgi:hypothetical protein